VLPSDEDETDVTSFKEKQEEMIQLLQRHFYRLETLGKSIQESDDEIKGIDGILKFSKQIPLYRDSAMNVIVRVFKELDKVEGELREIHFEWFPYEKEIMAVYTRYGELKILKKEGKKPKPVSAEPEEKKERKSIDPSLEKFISLYRTYLFAVQQYLDKMGEIRNECNFLLNSKLD